jgi:hypothetical protein
VDDHRHIPEDMAVADVVVEDRIRHLVPEDMVAVCVAVERIRHHPSDLLLLLLLHSRP